MFSKGLCPFYIWKRKINILASSLNGMNNPLWKAPVPSHESGPPPAPKTLPENLNFKSAEMLNGPFCYENVPRFDLNVVMSSTGTRFLFTKSVSQNRNWPKYFSWEVHLSGNGHCWHFKLMHSGMQSWAQKAKICLPFCACVCVWGGCLPKLCQLGYKDTLTSQMHWTLCL